MAGPETVTSLPVIYKPLSIVDARVEEAALWLPSGSTGLSVVRTIDFARQIGRGRQLHEYGKCNCCDGPLINRPNQTKGYGKGTQHVVANTFYRPVIKTDSPEDLADQLVTAADITGKPAELLSWVDIKMSSHGECYKEYGEPYGPAISRGLVTTREYVGNKEKAVGAMTKHPWLASAAILVLSR